MAAFIGEPDSLLKNRINCRSFLAALFNQGAYSVSGVVVAGCHGKQQQADTGNQSDRGQRIGKGYRIRHAQILLKLDQKPENKAWTYDRIKDAYGAARSTIAGIAQRFVMGGMEAALGRKVQEDRRRKVTGDVEARICAIACSEPPEGASRWTMQAIADELIRLEVVDYITDSTVCEVMKKMKSSRGS